MFTMAFCNVLKSTLTRVSRNYLRKPNFTSNQFRFLSGEMPAPDPKRKEVEVTFIKANGDRIKAKGKVGESLLDVVVNNNIDLEGFGACEGTITCSTCHLIFKQDVYDKLLDKPSEEELDMLDLAYELCDTSRLGCQITLTDQMDKLEVKVPSTINDVRES